MSSCAGQTVASIIAYLPATLQVATTCGAGHGRGGGGARCAGKQPGVAHSRPEACCAWSANP